MVLAVPLGIPRHSAVVEPYDPNWPVLFEEERHRIVEAVGHIVAGVHHVGSTSIPGMPAKPILDIAVLLHKLEDGERCIEPLESIGYVHRRPLLSQGTSSARGLPRRRSDQDSYPTYVHARQPHQAEPHCFS